MSNDLQSAVERLRKKAVKIDDSCSVLVRPADLRLVLAHLAETNAALAEAQAECLEQSRLLGKSGSREADLLGKLARLAVERDRLERELIKAQENK